MTEVFINSIMKHILFFTTGLVCTWMHFLKLIVVNVNVVMLQMMILLLQVLGDVGLGLNVGVGVLSHSNSADSSESDTTEDDVDAGGQFDRVLSSHRRIDVDVIKHADSPLLARQPGIQPCKQKISNSFTLHHDWLRQFYTIH